MVPHSKIFMSVMYSALNFHDKHQCLGPQHSGRAGNVIKVLKQAIFCSPINDIKEIDPTEKQTKQKLK